MTESRSHLAGTTPFQNRIPVRLLAPQHVKGRLGQMARHCSNGFVVSLTLAQAVIELACGGLRAGAVVGGPRGWRLLSTATSVGGPGCPPSCLPARGGLVVCAGAC